MNDQLREEQRGLAEEDYSRSCCYCLSICLWHRGKMIKTAAYGESAASFVVAVCS